MAGLHFYCGKWLGEDKSADPLFDVIDDVRELVSPAEQELWDHEFVPALESQQQNEEIEFSSAMLNAIVDPVRRYQAILVSRLGLSGLDASIEELGDFPRTISEDEKKFLCVVDLLRGHEVVTRTGKPLVVHFC